MVQIPPNNIARSRSKQPVVPAAAELNLDIQQVVLQDISIGDSSIFIQALQQELTQLLSHSADFTHYQNYRQNHQVDSIQRETTVAATSLSASQDIYQLAKPIAEAIYAALLTQLQ